VLAIMLQTFTLRQNAADAIEIAVALSFQRPQILHPQLQLCITIQNHDY
jgi:hypothetical protein